MNSSFALLSHTNFSQQLLNAPLGEVANSFKLKHLLENCCQTALFDIYELCGENIEWFYSLAHLNMTMFQEESDPLISLEQPSFKELRKCFRVATKSYSHLLCLTWAQSLAGLLGIGLFEGKKALAKFYLFHAQEKIPLKLYEPFDLLVTESPLALVKAESLGIPSHKLLYLPHQFPQEVESLSKNRSLYKSKLLKKLGRKDTGLLIGMFCRFQYRKNVEYALRALSRLYEEGYVFTFYLKGCFDGSLEGEEKKYTNWLQELFVYYQNAPWLIWSKIATPFPAILEEYTAVDVALQLSGAESGSNTIVEQMALGVAVIVLNCSTNPSLFGNGVEYVKTSQLAPGALPFYTPDEEDLYLKIKNYLNCEALRNDLSERALNTAHQRFRPQKCLEKIPLMIDIDSTKAMKQREKNFSNDLKEYDVS